MLFSRSKHNTMNLDKRSYALRTADILCKLDAFRLLDSGHLERLKERFDKDTVEFCLANRNRSFAEVKNALVKELELLQSEVSVWLSSLTAERNTRSGNNANASGNLV